MAATSEVEDASSSKQLELRGRVSYEWFMVYRSFRLINQRVQTLAGVDMRRSGIEEHRTTCRGVVPKKERCHVLLVIEIERWGRRSEACFRRRDGCVRPAGAGIISMQPGFCAKDGIDPDRTVRGLTRMSSYADLPCRLMSPR